MSNSENIEELIKAIAKYKLPIKKTKPNKIVKEEIKPVIKEEIKPVISIAMKNKRVKKNKNDKTIQKPSRILFDYENTTIEI